MTPKYIPITILTGFLGAGKTTLVNQIVKKNPDIRFGLIINEFGEVGIDGQIIDNPKEEIMEISNGCLCCVVRSDLVEAIKKMVNSGKVDYIIIETSGLAEPEPIMQTFMTLTTDGFDTPIKMDSLLTLVDAVNFESNIKEYKVIGQQIELADVVVLNKVENLSSEKLNELTSMVKNMNPLGSVVLNDKETPANLFIETGAWNVEKLLEIEKHQHSRDHKHGHHHHDDHDHETCTDPTHDHSHGHHNHHEHDDVQEVVFTSTKPLNPIKMDQWLSNSFPVNVIRAKGILQLQSQNGTRDFVFQMVGANKELIPMANYFNCKLPEVKQSSIVLIGKKLDKEKILEDLEKVIFE
jgi:G3E family GTPase